MNQFYSREFMRIFWPHWVGGLLFIGLYAYQLQVLTTNRPTEPDTDKDYTIEFGSSDDAVFVSALDITLIFGNFLIIAIIVLSGLWRVRKSQKLPDSSGTPT